MHTAMTNDPDVYNWRRVSDRLTTSGQPSEQELGEIKSLGVTHVINLGLHDHKKALADEAATVVGLGMQYIHIPVEFSHPTQDDFQRLVEAITRLADSPLHIHCIANLRVTAFLYRFNRDILKMSEQRARQVMDTVWRPGGVWAEFIGDEDSIDLPHREPKASGMREE